MFGSPITPYFHAASIDFHTTVLTFPATAVYLKLLNYGSSDVDLYLNGTVGPILVPTETVFELPPNAMHLTSISLVVKTSGQTSSDVEVIAGCMA